MAIDGFFDGGAEMFAIRLANHLPADVSVHFFALRPWLTHANRQQTLLDRARVSSVGLTGSRIIDALLAPMLQFARSGRHYRFEQRLLDWRLRYVCRRYGIQIVHSHSWETDKAFAAIKPGSSFKLVSSFHGHYELLQDAGAVCDAQSRAQLSVVDAVVFLSPQHIATLDKYGVPVSKRRRIFHGIPRVAADDVTHLRLNEPLKLVMAARGIAEKGWAEALEAVTTINRERGPRVTLDLVGTGEALDQLRQVYEGQPGIRFLGYRDDVLPIVRESHVGLLPSYFAAESLPNTVIEYLIAGKPVIATDAGAIREMVTHDDHVAGVVLPSSGKPVSVDRLKDAISIYLDEPARVAADSAIALRAAGAFSMDACVARYGELYQSLLPLEPSPNPLG